MNKAKKVTLAGAAGTLAFLLLGASSCQSASDSQQAEGNQQEQINQQYVKNQPLPQFDYSQMRQNLIEIETAQATGVQTTTFFFNQGVQDPIMFCPSVGVPMPNTASLSNPVGVEHHSGTDNGGNVGVGQMDPNGVYVPESSTGTYVMCIDAQGRPYAQYWEGFVHTVFAPARWDSGSHMVQLVGPPSFEFTKKQPK
jgi:hypothetical protein